MFDKPSNSYQSQSNDYDDENSSMSSISKGSSPESHKKSGHFAKPKTV